MKKSLALVVAIWRLVVAAGPVHVRPRPANNTYDYIVVGSGPGGGPLACNLARAGHSVLLIEAGDDQGGNPNSEIPGFFPFAYVDPTMRWDFFVRNFDNETRTLQNNHLTWRRADGTFYVGRTPPAGATLLGLYYPRGGTLGGSSAVNAMGAVLPSESDWQHVVDLTGDASWSPAAMRNIFIQMEKNHYLPPGTPGHGFNGYFDTNRANESVWDGYNDILSVLGTVSAGLGQTGSVVDKLVQDVNAADPARDQTQGVFGQTLHVSAANRRFSSRDYILATEAASNPDGSPKYPLHIQLNTLATRVVFDTSSSGGKGKGKGKGKGTSIEEEEPLPKATAVEFLTGSSLYRADPRSSPSNNGAPGLAYARKEVILSGGVFNTPQLLLLSGIGPASELSRHSITPVIAELPGVGSSLQDNYEVPLVAHARRSFVSPPPNPADPPCTFGLTPDDPCIPLFANGTGPYARMGQGSAIFRKSSLASERDFFFLGSTFAIRGFWPPTDSVAFDPPQTFALSTVKIHPGSKSGIVKLQSSDPRDVPEVNFRLFEGGTVEEAGDLQAYVDTVKWARRTLKNVAGDLGPVELVEPPCVGPQGEDGGCDDEADKEWLKNQMFGHHATSTARIGGSGDGMAVLDSKLRVRGVRGLRVVDASAFPRVPGPFPVLPTFMLSEKASVSVLEDAGSW